MKIFSSSGEELEQIEKTLDDSGFVVRGLMPIEDFLPDPLQALELRQQLRMAQIQLENKNEILGMKNEVITQMQTQIQELYSLVGPIAQRGAVHIYQAGQAGAVGPNAQTKSSEFQVGSPEPDRGNSG